MPPTRPPYPPELKRQIVELVRAGRSPSELAKEFALCKPPQGRPFFASFFWARKKMKSPKAWKNEKGGIITNTLDKIPRFFASVRNVSY